MKESPCSASVPRPQGSLGRHEDKKKKEEEEKHTMTGDWQWSMLLQVFGTYVQDLMPNSSLEATTI